MLMPSGKLILVERSLPSLDKARVLLMGQVVSPNSISLLDIAVDAHGNLFIADMLNHAIRKVTPSGVVSTIAGNGTPGAIDGNGAAATFNNPAGIAVDANGNIYVADQNNNMIRKIVLLANGTITVNTFAGSTTPGAADGIGVAASFSMPYGMTFDGNGDLFVADWSQSPDQEDHTGCPCYYGCRY